MDGIPLPYSDMAMAPATGGLTSSGSPALAERRTELILDALKVAIAEAGEHRLFRSGKLPGLFPTKIGPASDAALLALHNGLLESVRTETRGKVVVEWVRATPSAVAFVHDHDSPKAVLRELKHVLKATRDGIPACLDETRREMAVLSTRFEHRAAAMLRRLDDLANRVESALRRAEAKAPSVADPVARVVPWAVTALEYLDRRQASGAAGDCPLPELFHAVRVPFPELSLAGFQDGVRRLHDVRAVRLAPSEAIAEPEYAVVVEGKLMSAAGR